MADEQDQKPIDRDHLVDLLAKVIAARMVREIGGPQPPLESAIETHRRVELLEPVRLPPLIRDPVRDAVGYPIWATIRAHASSTPIDRIEYALRLRRAGWSQRETSAQSGIEREVFREIYGRFEGRFGDLGEMSVEEFVAAIGTMKSERARMGAERGQPGADGTGDGGAGSSNPAG